MWNPLQGMFDSRFTWEQISSNGPQMLVREISPTQVSIWQPWSSLEWWCKWNGILSLIHFPPSSHVCWLGGCIMLLVPIWWNAPVPTWDFLSLLLGFQKLNFFGDFSKNRLTCRNIICLTMVSHRISIWTDAVWSNWLKQIWCIWRLYTQRYCDLLLFQDVEDSQNEIWSGIFHNLPDVGPVPTRLSGKF